LLLQTVQLENILKKYLSDKRIAHSRRVANLARDMAERCGIEWHKAYTAGLLHDIARDMEKEELVYIVKEHDLYHDPMELDMPILLHTHVGAWIVENELGIKDETILEAIRLHTLAAPQMDNLAKILYIADMLEPERNLPGADELLETAMDDLDKAMVHCLNSTLKYLIDNGMIIHPLSVEARNYFLKRLESDSFCQIF